MAQEKKKSYIKTPKCHFSIFLTLLRYNLFIVEMFAGIGGICVVVVFLASVIIFSALDTNTERPK